MSVENGTPQRLKSKVGLTTHPSASEAVRELAAQIKMDEAKALTLVFCSPHYDLALLGAALKAAFGPTVVACTTAGELSSLGGYSEKSLVGASLASPELIVHRRFVPALEQFSQTYAERLCRELVNEVKLKRPERLVAFLLIDGLSLLEEQVVSLLYTYLGGVPIIGGSAGDGLSFAQTFVYEDGTFRKNAAQVLLLETSLPFRPFRIQHFEPQEERLVITDSDPAQRLVREINGKPAAEEYARLLGLRVRDLSPFVFSSHPFMMRIGSEYFLRSIQRLNGDGSLTFFCAVDNGLVMRTTQGANIVQSLEDGLEALRRELGGIDFLLGCDCILRRLELSDKALLLQAGEILKRQPCVGFSTYGEQFHGIHVNQTLTALAFGAS